MTTRAQRFFTSAAILSAIWLLLLLDVLPLPIIDHTAKQEILSAVSICYPKSSKVFPTYIAANYYLIGTLVDSCLHWIISSLSDRLGIVDFQ